MNLYFLPFYLNNVTRLKELGSDLSRYSSKEAIYIKKTMLINITIWIIKEWIAKE